MSGTSRPTGHLQSRPTEAAPRDRIGHSGAMSMAREADGDSVPLMCATPVGAPLAGRSSGAPVMAPVAPITARAGAVPILPGAGM
jgi:hypothetical protein